MVHVIDQEKCVKCGTCLDVCPARFSAVVKVSGEKVDVPQAADTGEGGKAEILGNLIRQKSFFRETLH